MFEWIAVIFSSFVLSLFAVMLLLKISRRMGWYDRTGPRKIHSGNIPRLGGMGFMFAFIVVLFFIVGPRLDEGGLPSRYFLLALGFALVVICGIRDDFKPVAPCYKFILQGCAALCVLLSGHVFDRFIWIDYFDFLSFPGWELFRYFFSFLWIVGMTNAVNFIDGVDGLAGGISLLAVLSFALISISLGANWVLLLSCASLAASLLGFLVLNVSFPRSKIFMGDGGAYFLGFALAVLPLIETGNAGTRLPVLYAVAILQIPILDTAAAILRRLREGRRIDSPDRSHTHHKLLYLGCSPYYIDAILFSLQICLSSLVYVAVQIPGYLSLVVLFLAYAIGLGFFTVLHVLNRQRLKMAVGIPQGIGLIPSSGVSK